MVTTEVVHTHTHTCTNSHTHEGWLISTKVDNCSGDLTVLRLRKSQGCFSLNSSTQINSEEVRTSWPKEINSWNLDILTPVIWE